MGLESGLREACNLHASSHPQGKVVGPHPKPRLQADFIFTKMRVAGGVEGAHQTVMGSPGGGVLGEAVTFYCQYFSSISIFILSTYSLGNFKIKKGGFAKSWAVRPEPQVATHP